MIGVVLFVTIVLCLAIAIKRRYEIDICWAFPFAINAISIILYVFCIFQIIKIGVIAVITLSIILLTVQRKKVKIERSEKWTIILWLFTTIIFIIIHFNRLVYWADDLGHWALVTKNIYFSGRFAVYDPISVEYTHYPELPSMPAYLALWLNGSWEEWILFFIQSLWTCTMLFPLLRGKHSIIQIVLIWCFILIFPLLWGGEGNAYTTLQVDRLIGISVGYCLFLCLKKTGNDRFTFLSVLFGTIVLTGIKESGLFFSILILAFYFICVKEDDITKKVRFNRTFFLLFCNLVIFISWKIVFLVSGSIIPENYYRPFSFEIIAKIINGSDTVRHQVLVDSINKLIQIDNYQWGANKSYLVMMLSYIGLLCIILWKQKRRWKQIVKCVCIIIFTIFCWFLGIMYVAFFRFPDDQIMNGFNSFYRYMDTCFMPIGMVMYGLLFDSFETNKIQRKGTYNIFVYGSCIGIFILCSFITLYSNAMAIYNTYQNSLVFRSWTQDKIEMDVVDTMDPYSDRIYIISQNDDKPLSGNYYQAKFIVSPVPVNLNFSSEQNGETGLSFYLSANHSDDVYKTYYSVAEWRKVLDDYSYLLLLNYGEDFIKSYGEMFRGDEIEFGLYKVSDGALSKVK